MAGFSFALAPKAKAGATAASASAATSGGRKTGSSGSGSGRIALTTFGGDDDDADEEEDEDGFERKAAQIKRSQGKDAPKLISVFGEDDDEDAQGGTGDGLEAGPSAKRTGPRIAKPTPTAAASNQHISRASRLAADQALAHDASIFEYDAVYDAMKSAEASAKQKKRDTEQAAGLVDQDGKPAPKYIDAFLKASAQRKRDHERAEAKKIQRERDAEGDEFADKEAFVTDAYREQMENIRKEEEEEAKRQAQNKSKGVQAFYSSLLSEQSAAHDAAVKAATAAAATTSKTEAANGSSAPSTKTEGQESETAALAQKIEAARAAGLAVEINDDNQVVDNRSLLNKGLNYISKNKPKKPTEDNNTASHLPHPARGGPNPRAPGGGTARTLSSAQSFHSAASRARQTSHLEAQLLEIQRKRAAEEELERQRTKAKLMGVAGGGALDGNEREKREEERRKAKERALARRAQASGGTGAGAAPTPS